MPGYRLGCAVIDSAAIIIISVVAGFIFSGPAIVRPLGFGEIVVVFIVRLLRIPAVLRLLGKTVWWFPRWFDRILPDINVEGATPGRTRAVLEPAAISSGSGSEFSASSHREDHATNQVRSTP